MGGASDPSFDKPITGSITALNGTVILDPIQKETQAVSILGTWSGTLIFEGSNDGSNWFTIAGFNVASRALVTTTTANGNFVILTAGFGQTRVRASLWSSGTANIANEGGIGTQGVWVFQDNASSLKAKAQLQDDSGASITLGQKTMAASVPMVIASDQTPVPIGGKNTSGALQEVALDREGRLSTNIGADRSVFGPLVVASRVQQLSADFSESLINNDIIQTTTGTGVISLSNANASISTGTGTTSSAQISSVSNVGYLPGREIYAQYTAAFTAPTSAASKQLTGLYNGTDGLVIGYNGLNFSIGTVAGGVFSFVASSLFNVDTLTGGPNSLFTRGGVPEAANFAFKNVFRIRAGWLGAAPIFFEIMSPDGNWVTFHIVRQPNSSVNPSFLKPSLPMTMLVSKTASDATNLVVTATSWDAGVVDVSGQTDSSDSGSISALNGTVSIAAQSQSTIVANVTGTWVGTIQVQGDVGDGTWNPIYAINTNAVAAQTITANATLIIACAGFQSVRLIGTAWSSGTANINWVASSGTQAIIAQVVGNIASGSTDYGNPIKVGGVFNTTLPVVSSGSRVDLQLDQNGRLLTSTAVTSSLPAATFSNQRAIPAGTTIYTGFTAAVKLAIKQFYAGGTGIGKQVLYSYAPSNTQLINSGDFETAGDVTNWPYFSSGAGGTGSAALSTAQANTGTHSEAVTFTTSDSNHINGIKQTFGTALDISGWRYVTAQFFNTVSAGATYTRTISIVLTDSNGSTRKYDVSGASNVAPFNASNWIKITGEIANPTSSTGTAFDPTSIASIELRMVDSANRAGTVYWDTARLEAQLTPVFPIYHPANTSFNIPIDPVFVMNIADQILIAQTNNDSTKQEFYAVAGGVQI
jgi:hypothetical protein